MTQSATPSLIHAVNTPHQVGELLSALVDGELEHVEVVVTLDAAVHQAEMAGRWDAYHVIGEVLRSPASVVRSADMAFLSRVSQSIAQEPLPGSVTRGGPGIPLPAGPTPVERLDAPAANDDTFRWKLVAGFASLAAVASIAWTSAGVLSPVAAPQLAQAAGTSRVVVASPQGPMVRDARLEELLAAHKQLGGTSALQEPSGFLRNATFETSQGTGR